MLISIAMATYNGAAFLTEQLDSFLGQTRLPDELVVCDDCSTDSTASILEAFQRQAPFPVRIFRNETNLGYVKNFEKALSLCEGDIIFLSDQDDVWFDNKLQVMERVFADNPHAMVAINDQVITDKYLRPTPFTKLGNLRKAGLPDSWFITGCCTSIRRGWINVILPFPPNIRGHDGWIGRMANDLQVRVVHQVPLQFYRRHGDNASSSLNMSLISSKGRLSKFRFHRAHGLKDLRDEWEKSLLEAGQHIDRLQKFSLSLLDGPLRAAANEAIAKYTNRVASLQQRIAVTSKPRWRRLPDVIHLYAKGGYGAFAGWRSAVKDLLRP